MSATPAPTPDNGAFARVERFLADTTPPAGAENAMLPLFRTAHDMTYAAMSVKEGVDVEERITRVIDYRDLDSAIQNFFGSSPILTWDQKLAARNFECVTDQEWSNDSNYTISIREGGLDSYDDAKLRKFLAGQHQPYMLNILTTVLANAGALNAGDYLVEVSW